MLNHTTLQDPEQWHDIPGYEGIYAISTHGRIKRLRGTRGYAAGHIFTPSIDRDGYLRTTLRKDGGSKLFRVHQLVAITFLPAPVEGQSDVNHIDGNKQNNHISNLEWVTRSENVSHAVRLGLQPVFKGEEQAQAKLTDDDVRDIRRLYVKNGYPNLADLAKKYGVDRALIHRIILRKSWKHVE